MNPEPRKPQRSRPTAQVGIEDLLKSLSLGDKSTQPNISTGSRPRRPSRVPDSAPKPALKPNEPKKINQPVAGSAIQDFAPSQSITFGHGQPYNRYQNAYSLRIGQRLFSVLSLTNPTTKDRHCGGLAEVFNGNDATQQIRNIQGIRHPRFLEALDTYKTDDGMLVVFQFMPFSLFELSTVQELKDPHLAAIISQVIDGLLFLKTPHLKHETLIPANVLVNYKGEVKIWAREFSFDVSSRNVCKELFILMSRFMQLPEQHMTANMQAHSLPGHCAAFPHAVDFLFAVKAAAEKVEHSYAKDDSALQRLSKVEEAPRTF
ncbi:hypothetical protein BGZ63DRAFT_438407 [Mariannaea sp. PMI_226]|nr:hypothetical protein BGZ63DRAFT_438407 [Mariannaea sp. PMI_226]